MYSLAQLGTPDNCRDYVTMFQTKNCCLLPCRYLFTLFQLYFDTKVLVVFCMSQQPFHVAAWSFSRRYKIDA